MRRRERYRELVWIKELPGDPAEGRALAKPATLRDMGAAMRLLNKELGLVVEMELVDGAFFLRTFPRPGARERGMPTVAASYTGPSLAALLSCAVRDYELYRSDPDLARYSPREVIRWVA
jgi:hypothetical protein